jgi:hypothetical protein
MLSAVSAFMMQARGVQISLGSISGMAIDLSKAIPAHY